MSEVDHMMLHQHGTKAFVLKPGAIVGAARQDLSIKAAKAEGTCEAARHYAFHRRHVAKAKCVGDLLSLALEERWRGEESGKRNTQLIYGDPELLSAALTMVERLQAAE